MPIKYIGRLTNYAGKPLWQILYKLKHFGVGRVVYRNTFHTRYPEPCYYVITRVEPFPESKREGTKIKIIGKKVFRGVDIGEMGIAANFKPDWRLVPKNEEDQWLNHSVEPRSPNVIQDTVPFPPLLERMIQRDLSAAGLDTSQQPVLKLDILQTRHNQAKLQSQLQSS